MNATYVQRGEYIDFVPETDIEAGDIVARGRLVGISKLPIKAGELGAIATTGIYDVTKGDEAFAAGDKVYWKSDEKKAAKEGGVVLGLCVIDADASCDTVRVILRGGYGGNAGGGSGGNPTTPSGAIADVALASVTEGGTWTGGDSNVNVVTDFQALRDTLNAVLNALRSHDIIEED